LAAVPNHRPRSGVAEDSVGRLGIARAADEAELDDIYETERRLLYVACARASRADRHDSGVRISRRFLLDVLTRVRRARPIRHSNT
jgi:hypothetical protein